MRKAPKRIEDLSRRERQIMSAVLRNSRATAVEIHQEIKDAPSLDAVRRMIRILEEKGFLTHSTDGPRHVYRATVEPEEAGRKAMRSVLETYFEGSISQAVAALVDDADRHLPPEEKEALERLIRQAEEEGR